MAKLYNQNSCVFSLLYLIAITFFHSQTSCFGCVLDIDQSSAPNNSACETGNWGGFISNNCGCKTAFEDYLYALTLRANRTKRLFLSPKEQKDCLLSMASIDKDVSGCGFMNLTSGLGGCSDFSTDNVFEKLGSTIEKLEKDCEILGSMGISGTKSCKTCLERWEQIVSSPSNATDSERNEDLVCGFSVLITLTGGRAGDKNWIQALYECLGDQESPTKNEKQTSDGRKLRTGLWILAGGIAGIIALMVIILIWKFCKERIKESLLSDKTDNSLWTRTSDTSCTKIPVKEVYSATSNLNSSNFIGQGVAGKVYKGKLSDGRHVAVKHIVKDGQEDTFLREVKSLSHVRHPNLIALIGFSESADECFLVYELCHNGNLSEWLFGKDKALFWIQRLRIAIDSAKGLQFLHSYPQGCIVHRDIKPTNILIDDRFRAKLSDFGLSKVIDLGQSYVSSEVRGTLGYVDPEYRENHRVNPSGDVYSFGMVLLQLLSGQRVINLSLTGFRPLKKTARSLVADGDIEKFADPKLDIEFPCEAFEIVLELALECTGIKRQRPSMSQVVSRLERALEISTLFFTNSD